MDINRTRENIMYEIEKRDDIEEKLKFYINGFIEELKIMKKCWYNNKISEKYNGIAW